MKITIIGYPETDRCIFRILSSFLLLVLLTFSSYSQDLYDLQHSRQYAEYLTSSHQYKLAAEEYERLVFLDSSNQAFKYNLIKSYRLAGEFSSGIRRIYSFYGPGDKNMPAPLASEFIRLEMLTDSLSVIDRYAALNTTLTGKERAEFLCLRLLLDGNYREAERVAAEAGEKYRAFPSGITDLTKEAGKIRLKSPLVAGAFSAIVPGTGKFYTKNWADGVFSMIFVAGSAWQAYRGFKKQGSNSAYGWTFATVSASFYLGNIYGSVKAARRYNKNRKDEINNQVFVFVNSDSF